MGQNGLFFICGDHRVEGELVIHHVQHGGKLSPETVVAVDLVGNAHIATLRLAAGHAKRVEQGFCRPCWPMDFNLESGGNLADHDMEVALDGWGRCTADEKVRMVMRHLFHAEVLAIWQGMPVGIVDFQDRDLDAAIMVSPAAKLVQKCDGALDAVFAAGIEPTDVERGTTLHDDELIVLSLSWRGLDGSKWRIHCKERWELDNMKGNKERVNADKAPSHQVGVEHQLEHLEPKPLRSNTSALYPSSDMS